MQIKFLIQKEINLIIFVYTLIRLQEAAKERLLFSAIYFRTVISHAIKTNVPYDE